MAMTDGKRWATVTVGLLVGLLGARLGSGMVLAQEHSADPAVVATMAESAVLSAEQVVEKMARAFRAVKTYQATGATMVEQQARGRTQRREFSFELRLRRSDRFYFKTLLEQGGFLAAWDGKTGWVYAIHENQYQKYEGLAGPEQFIEVAIPVTAIAWLPLTYTRGLLAADPKSAILSGVARTELRTGEAPQTYILTLYRQGGPVVELLVGQQDFMLQSAFFDLTAVIRRDAAENNRTLPEGFKATVTVTYAKPTRDKVVDNEAFTFTPPQGAELVTEFGPQPLAGKPAPDFTLTSLSGQQARLSELRGRVVLLDFWATWCPPCRVSMPHLEKLRQEFAQKGLTVLGVTTEDADTVEPFIREHKITFPILLDPDGVAARAYRVTAIPRSLIIDREGKVHADLTGWGGEEVVRAKLAELGIK